MIALHYAVWKSFKKIAKILPEPGFEVHLEDEVFSFSFF